ncbi:MAG: GspE/PulE family protein, partial [bacterium]
NFKSEMRLSTIPTEYGEKMVVRIFNREMVNHRLENIGFLKKDKNRWEKLINSRQGLILVTGPTGSGRTTTLYASMNTISTPEINVCTAEDPIEVLVDSFNQVQVNHHIGLNFAKTVRSFFRQDPDIIMIGEIRDLETAEVATQASLTGHLVFSTLHTNGALESIQRLVDIGLPTFLIKSSLNAILTQKLVRKLCPHCKKKVSTSPEQWHSFIGNDKLPYPKYSYKAQGCSSCNDTGFNGRTCLYELVEFNDKLKRIIHPEVELSELKEKSKGMFTTIRENALQKVISGETSLDEVMRLIY